MISRRDAERREKQVDRGEGSPFTLLSSLRLCVSAGEIPTIKSVNRKMKDAKLLIVRAVPPRTALFVVGKWLSYLEVMKEIHQEVPENSRCRIACSTASLVAFFSLPVRVRCSKNSRFPLAPVIGEVMRPWKQRPIL